MTRPTCRYCEAGYAVNYRTGIRIVPCSAAFHDCAVCGAGPCAYGLKFDDCTVEKRP